LALKVDETGQFVAIDQDDSLALMLEQELPDEALALDIPFGSIARVVGYQLKPSEWEGGKSNEIILYWQPLREANFVTALVDQFQLTLHVTTTGAKEPLATTTLPIFPVRPAEQNLKRASIVRASYPLSIPAVLPANEYLLDICLTTSNQAISQTGDCLTIPVVVRGNATN
jgi:hypothetical protein